MSLGAYLNLRLLVRSLRPLREQACLSLAEMSQRSGMDKAMLSRLENGHLPNPGIETISRYVNALDKDIEWRVVAAATRRRGPMERYAARRGDSGITAYEIAPESITIQFTNGAVYEYTYASAGQSDVERMKLLAQSGQGLSTFISTTVKEQYARKLR